MILYNTAYGFFIQNNTAFTNLKIHSRAFEIERLLHYYEPTVLTKQQPLIIRRLRAGPTTQARSTEYTTATNCHQNLNGN